MKKTTKTTTDIRERIAVRAYFLTQNRTPAAYRIVGHDPVRDWLIAERIELKLATDRSTAAKKATATRKAKAAEKAPAEMLVVATRRPALRPTAH